MFWVGEQEHERYQVQDALGEANDDRPDERDDLEDVEDVVCASLHAIWRSEGFGAIGSHDAESEDLLAEPTTHVGVHCGVVHSDDERADQGEDDQRRISKVEAVATIEGAERDRAAASNETENEADEEDQNRIDDRCGYSHPRIGEFSAVGDGACSRHDVAVLLLRSLLLRAAYPLRAVPPTNGTRRISLCVVPTGRLIVSTHVISHALCIYWSAYANGSSAHGIPTVDCVRHSATACSAPYSEIVQLIEYESHDIPELERPIFIMALQGLFDMGEAATAAVDWLSMTHNGKPAASIDPEMLFDFQEVRPQVKLGANGNREIHWPTNNVLWAKTPAGLSDLVLLSGVEPNLRWRSYCATLREIIELTGAVQVVTLGAALAMVPHTRSFPVTASTSDAELAARLKISMPSYEGPTGLIGSLHHELAGSPLPTLSLRVNVPHYVPGSPSPKATSALLAHLEQLCDVPTDHVGMADEIRDWESQVHQALADDEDVRAYVKDLEMKSDNEPEILLDTREMAEEVERLSLIHI